MRFPFARQTNDKIRFLKLDRKQSVTLQIQQSFVNNLDREQQFDPTTSANHKQIICQKRTNLQASV